MGPSRAEANVSSVGRRGRGPAVGATTAAGSEPDSAVCLGDRVGAVGERCGGEPAGDDGSHLGQPFALSGSLRARPVGGLGSRPGRCVRRPCALVGRPPGGGGVGPGSGRLVGRSPGGGLVSWSPSCSGIRSASG